MISIPALAPISKSARRALLAELRWMADQSRMPRWRLMRRFAEEEIIIPDGPFKGTRFSCTRQPFTGLWLDLVDSGRWQRHYSTGPVQSGKTLLCFCMPTLYHLFELSETVICGVPDLNMSGDKWREDLLPAIEASRYRELLPDRGGGSRGGIVRSVEFRHGPTLRFMTGGGGDKTRAGFTSRVLVITEVDGMDEIGASSRESDKITQLEGRTRAYRKGKRHRIYGECTVSIEAGRTWREVKGSTDTRLVIPCPHCGGLVTPERDHLAGWQDAATVIEAGEKAHFVCPACSKPWTEAERIKANAAARVVHKGQEITPDREIVGEPEATDTLGFRWSAVNNLFVEAANLGMDEWRAARASDEANADREMRQFVWAVPVAPASRNLTTLDVDGITSRTTNDPRGVVPAGTQFIGLGIDIGMHLAHWAALAFRDGASPHVFAYSALEVPTQQIGEDRAILSALREFRDQYVEPGWTAADGCTLERNKSGKLSPDIILIDARYQGRKADVFPVYEFCRESSAITNRAGWPRYYPAMGFAAGQFGSSEYRAPTQVGQTVVSIGERYHIARVMRAGYRLMLVEFDADHWKSWIHKRLQVGVGQPGALTLHAGTPADHLKLAKHFSSEQESQEYDARRGWVIRWENPQGRPNHLLDAGSMACVAGHLSGARLLETRSVVAAVPAEAPARQTGESWIKPRGDDTRTEFRRRGSWLRG